MAQFDLPEHLSRERRSIVRKRLARAESVKKHALELSKALDALDDTDRFAVTHLVERRHGESRAEIARQRNRLVKELNLSQISALLRLANSGNSKVRVRGLWLHISYFWTLLQSSNG